LPPPLPPLTTLPPPPKTSSIPEKPPERKDSKKDLGAQPKKHATPKGPKSASPATPPIPEHNDYRPRTLTQLLEEDDSDSDTNNQDLSDTPPPKLGLPPPILEKPPPISTPGVTIAAVDVLKPPKSEITQEPKKPAKVDNTDDVKPAIKPNVAAYSFLLKEVEKQEQQKQTINPNDKKKKKNK